MNKLIAVLIFIVVGLALMPVIGDMVANNQELDKSITFNLTTTATVISHDLSDSQIEYILNNNDSITDVSDITILAGSATESFTSGIYTAEPESMALTFDTATLTLTDSTKAITSDVTLVEGVQTITITILLANSTAVVSLVNLIPIIVVISIVAGTILYIKFKN